MQCSINNVHLAKIVDFGCCKMFYKRVDQKTFFEGLVEKFFLKGKSKKNFFNYFFSV